MPSAFSRPCSDQGAAENHTTVNSVKKWPSIGCQTLRSPLQSRSELALGKDALDARAVEQKSSELATVVSCIGSAGSIIATQGEMRGRLGLSRCGV